MFLLVKDRFDTFVNYIHLGVIQLLLPQRYVVVNEKVIQAEAAPAFSNNIKRRRRSTQ